MSHKTILPCTPQNGKNEKDRKYQGLTREQSDGNCPYTVGLKARWSNHFGNWSSVPTKDECTPTL